MSLRKLVGIAVAIGASVVLWEVTAAPPANGLAEAEAALMRAKLASSQKIVEGLMVQDFNLVQQAALELEKICDATQWHAEQDQVYSHYRAALRRTAKKLAGLAKDQDKDGITYTYLNSVTTCINCHDYCRDVLRIARFPLDLQRIPLDVDEGSSEAPIRR